MAKKIEKVDLGEHGTFEVHKGKLHEALGIPSDETIPEGRLDSALHSKNPATRREAASAKGFRAMNHKK